MSVNVIASVVCDGRTVADVRKFLDECDLYCVPDTTELFDYPALFFTPERLRPHIASIGTVYRPTVGDVKAWIIEHEDVDASTVAMVEESDGLVVDFPQTRVEQITCGDHIPEKVGDTYADPPLNLHVVVNPECYHHADKDDMEEEADTEIR